MPQLILVKHAAPEVDPNVPSEQWRLSEKGRASCMPLAASLGSYSPLVVVSSEEPKAAETAELVATALKVPWETAPGLHEHNRSNVPHMRSGDFISTMELLFRKPQQLVLGRETASGALKRFQNAIDDVLERHPADKGNVAVVTHGTVIALLLAHHTGQSGFDLWRRMQLPSFAVLQVPEFRLLKLVDRVPGA
jgi:broad specificity phosphatase PhoE